MKSVCLFLSLFAMVKLDQMALTSCTVQLTAKSSQGSPLKASQIAETTSDKPDQKEGDEKSKSSNAKNEAEEIKNDIKSTEAKQKQQLENQPRLLSRILAGEVLDNPDLSSTASVDSLSKIDTGVENTSTAQSSIILNNDIPQQNDQTQKVDFKVVQPQQDNVAKSPVSLDRMPAGSISEDNSPSGSSTAPASQDLHQKTAQTDAAGNLLSGQPAAEANDFVEVHVQCSIQSAQQFEEADQNFDCKRGSKEFKMIHKTKEGVEEESVHQFDKVFEKFSSFKSPELEHVFKDPSKKISFEVDREKCIFTFNFAKNIQTFILVASALLLAP